jgi:hypothetical protein
MQTEKVPLRSQVIANELQGLSAKVSRSGCPDVMFEVVSRSLLCKSVYSFLCQWALHVFAPAGCPEIKWSSLSEVTNDDLQFREAVKDSVADDFEDIERDTIGEAVK